MALIFKDRVKETTTTAGTGPVTLAGAATGGFQRFQDAMSVNDTAYYAIEDPTANAWEVGLGTLTATTTLTRTTVLASSNGGAAVNLSAASKNVFITVPSAWLAGLVSAGSQNANLVFAGPSSGGAAAPTFRALVAADIPNNAANTTGSAGSLSAVLGAAAFPALTGDVTTVAGALATTLKPSVTIVTPTIASFTNAQHTHQNAAGGGTLDAAAIATGVLNNAQVNWASPSAIGGTAAAAGTFTTLTAQNVVVAQTATTGSPASELVVTGAAHTALTLSTEYTDINLNLARTVQFATGAITTQRAVRIQAPTYSFVAASTITNAATLSIDGAPVAGTNATLTNTQAFMVTSSGTPVNRIAGNGSVHIGNNTSGFGSIGSIGFTLNQSSLKYAGLLAGTTAVGFVIDNTARFVIDAATSYATMFNTGAVWPFQMFPTTNNFLLSDGSVSSTDPSVKLAVVKNDGVTAGITNILTITHALSSGNTAAPNIGTGLVFAAADSTSAIGVGVQVGAINATLPNSTHASRTGRVDITVTDNAATRTVLSAGANGSAATFSLFNATPVIQQTMGVATAAATYGSNEQTMIQTMWNLLRTYGLGT